MSVSVEQRLREAAGWLARGMPAQARAELEALRLAAPRDVRTRLLSARIALKEDRIRDATRDALAAADQVPAEAQLLLATVDLLLDVGEVPEARRCLAHPVLERSQDPGCLLRAAHFRQRLDENAEALRLIGHALDAGAEPDGCSLDHGAQLYFNGRLAEAESRLEAGLRRSPGSGRIALALARLRRRGTADHHLDLFADGLAQVARGTPDHAALLFAAYKELEDLGRYDEAWRALVQGNAVMRARRPWNAVAHSAHLDGLLAACDAARVAPGVSVDAGAQPIFIIGMPRSGTTVLERMLGNHPRVGGAAELVDFGMQLHWAADTARTDGDAFMARIGGLDLGEVGRRYLARTRWRAHGTGFFIDKQPPNWAMAGFIHAALPGARILHLVRDPMDVCFSNWRAFFGGAYAYSYDLAALAAYHRDHRRAMAHWHAVMPGAILDVDYADLVREPEATLRNVLGFCGLAWEPGCADITRNAAPSATLSAAQVRAPLHDRAFGEWQPYAAGLAPLRAALAEEAVTAGSP